MKKIGKQLLHITGCACIAVLSLMQSAHAEPVDLSDIPLYVFEGVDPNIILSMDDSGSMYWSYMPDGIKYQSQTRRAKSAVYNRIYYDPTVTYLPPTDEHGASLGDVSFTNAWNDGFDQAGTCTINLATVYRPTWYYANSGGDNCDPWERTGSTPEYAGPAEPAYYYVFDATNSSNCTVTDDSCYDQVVVGASSGPGGTDERTNFANWYSYYRKRIYITKSAAARAFSNLSGGFRLAHQTINGGGSLTDVELYTGSARGSYYDWLFALDATGSTPLRTAVMRAGEYLRTEDPYRDDPADSSTPERACRQNFHVMLTDGYWTDYYYGITGNQDNQGWTLPDNDLGITSYSPRPPYRDANTSYVADNTFYYWAKDLRPSLENNVPTNIVDTSTDIDGDGDVDDVDIFWNPENDPANWQHMVNFTIGLGVFGQRAFPDDYEALLSGDLDWPTSAAPSDLDKIDDLWHAAINSRGQYFSAADATEMVEAFQNVIGDIVDRTGSSSAVALNAGAISSDSQLYQARFDTSGWSGHLLAKRISDGSNCGTVPVGTICENLWDAACKLDGGLCEATGTTVAAQGSRQIITMNSDTRDGIALAWDDLSADQQAMLQDPDGPLGAAPLDTDYGKGVLAFLRGDRSNEAGSGGTFRTRTSILGDIIYSSPIYVGPPDRFYEKNANFSEGDSYGAFATAHDARVPIVFVGSNDGMVHGFLASNGEERIAYVPDEIFGDLWRLHQTNYVHNSFVDGPLATGDVYYGSDWHTVVVGGLGLGGQGYYALDVTYASALSESNAAGTVLWEFTDADDADLGNSYGKPAIVRLHNGTWAAVFGNGLNSTDLSDAHVSGDGDATVFIVNIQTGALIQKLETKTGAAEDPDGLSRPNGIVGIAPVDFDADFVVDALYATDLFGNVWAYDLSSSSPSSWTPKYGNPGVPEPLYSAADANGNAQPITTPPVVGKHPTGIGVMVYFGTGKYLGATDIVDFSTQTFYGVWDNGVNGFDRDLLVEQTVTLVNLTQFSGVDARVVSSEPLRWDDGVTPLDIDEKRGWYLDLPELGERVHQQPFLRNDRIIFVTVTPSDDPCESGGSSWLMELDAADGSRLANTPFDYNGDGVFTKEDLVQMDYDVNGDGQVNADDVLPGSGIRVDHSGVITTPAVALHPDGKTESKFSSASTGQVVSVTEDSGLNRNRSWVELR